MRNIAGWSWRRFEINIFVLVLHGIRIIASTRKSKTEIVERALCTCMTAATPKIVSSQCLRDSSLILGTRYVSYKIIENQALIRRVIIVVVVVVVVVGLESYYALHKCSLHSTYTMTKHLYIQ